VATCELVAAVTEPERITVLHYDADYEIMANVTGQAIRWVVPPDSFQVVATASGVPGVAARMV
jgi:hypothetical protein